MNRNSLLELLAQLSVAVAGFSGVAGAFRSSGQSWSPWDSINIRLVLLLSLVACGLSLVPLFLDNSNPWIPGIVFVLAWLGVSGYWLRLVKEVSERPRGPWPLIVFAHFSALFLGIASIWVAPVLYTLGVALLLGLSAACFFAFTTFFRPATPQGCQEVNHMLSEPRGDSRKNWPGALMFGLLYPAVLGTFFYSLLPETLQALRDPLQQNLLQGTKLLLSFLLIAHFLIDFYLTQQVALETQDYPTATFVLDLLIVLALFVAYDTVHLDDKGVKPEVAWIAGAMFASYVLFRIWGRKMRPVIGKRRGLAAYETGSAVAFLVVAIAWPKPYALAIVLFGSALLMWFLGAPIVDEFHRMQHKDK